MTDQGLTETHRPDSQSTLPKKPSTTPTLGEMGEQRALDYLRQNGLKLIERNYRCLFGEIDLVMRDKDCLVFVEVKQRKNNHFGSPLEMVSVSKQQKLRRSAEHYLNHHKISQHHQAMRFDAVGIIADTINNPSAELQKSIEWVQNAF